MSPALPRSVGHRISIAAKLHCVAALSMLAVLALAGASVHFAYGVRGAAKELHDDGVALNNKASHLELLLQQHRRAVEGAPAELDRERLVALDRRVKDLDTQLADLLRDDGSTGTGDLREGEMRAHLRRELPVLRKAALRVLECAYNLVQDQALEASQGPYESVADSMQNRIAQWKAERAAILGAEMGRMSDSADLLVFWVGVSTLAVLLLGLLGLATTHQVLGRLGAIRRAMLRLANRDVAVAVPYLADRDEIGAMAGAVQVFKENASELRRASLRFESAVNNMSQGLCMYDAEHRLDVFNERFCSIFGIDPRQLRPGLSFAEVVQLSAEAGNHTVEEMRDIIAERQKSLQTRRPQTTLLSITGGRVISVALCPMEAGGWVSTYEDITERLRSQERLAYLARHDPLTGLPNRLMFRETLEHALSYGQGSGKGAVLLLDLDGFKAVNDSLGHPVGDQLLCAVGQRLREVVRDTDLVARLGGDEFAIIQAASAGQPEQSAGLAARLVEVLRRPLDLGGHTVEIGTSVGVAIEADEAVSTPDDILRNADIALYRAKAAGRGTWRCFEPGMDIELQQRRCLEADLRRALAQEHLELHYQPLVDAQTCALTGFEALVRWRHPERGMVPPGEFIPLAEETGLIRPIGAWVLARACADAAAYWPAHTKIAVNLSPVQFVDGAALVADVARALASSGLGAHRLELEITESLLLDDSPATIEVLHKLRELGAHISMDDFGTGYSSLSYLRRFPFDKIKIDQSFVRGLDREKGSVEIVRAVVGLGRALGMSVLAEGVETAEQHGILRHEGCHELQGYLFSRPRPVQDVNKLLATGFLAAEGASPMSYFAAGYGRTEVAVE